ncbi:MAG: S9 family peptidase [Phycisphaerae bacterium]
MSQMILLFGIALGTAVGLAAVPASAESHPFSVHDLVAFERISDVQLAPDGRRVAFTIRATDLEANKGKTDLWLMNADGAALRRLTTHAAAASSPRWSPDGRTIYFLTARSDSQQVWRIAPDGGEAEQVTKLPLDVGCFKVSPDGKRLVVALEVFPGQSPDATKKKLDEDGKRKATGKLYDKLFFRHWDTWKDGRRSHLFAVAVDGSGSPIDLMKELDADAPPKPFGGDEEFAITTDGTGVVFAVRNQGPREAWSTQFDLMLSPIDGSAPPRVVVDGKGATTSSPQFSPDGKTLAYLKMMKPGYEADRQRIVLLDWPAGQPRVLTEAWDRSPGKLDWSRDGRTLYASADHLGQHALFAVDAASGAAREVVKQGHVADFAVGGERIFVALDHLRSPVEIYAVSPAGGEPTQLTHVNQARLSACRLGEPEQFSCKGWNDEPVHVYVVKPVDFDPAKKYPVAFLIHGGPQGSFGNDFHYRWNPQTYAGAGYAAVMVDFHGSTGYGQAFTDAINGHWGDRPLEDLQKGLAATLAKYPWMDGDRVAALGASFGGYMINWIAGAWPDRFRCLVCHDGNLDERMAYYDTEELWFPEYEHGGPPWEGGASYTTHNPIDLVGQWKTPMLVIHGGRDYRVVDTHGMSTFTALQRRGIPSRFLYFPDENHWVLKPANSILWHETVLGWLDQWCRK